MRVIIICKLLEDLHSMQANHKSCSEFSHYYMNPVVFLSQIID